MLYYELFHADKSSAKTFENNFITPIVVSENNFYLIEAKKHG